MGTMVADLYAVLGLKPDEAAWAKGDKLISGVKQGLAFFAGYEAVRKISELINSTIELGGHLDDLRQKTGLSAEALQQWGYVAKLGGSSMDGIADGTKHFARTLKEAADGSEDANKALHAAGLTSAAVAKAMKGGDGLDAALMEIASRFADMPDGPKKTALAMQLFGKSGADLIPTLNLGAQGIDKLRKEAVELGVVMSEDTVGAADALGDNIDKAKMAVIGLKNQAIAALLPTLKEMVDGFLAWVKANKQLIIDSITVAVKALISTLGILSDIVGVVVDAIEFFREHAELTRAVLIALGVVITAVAAEAIVAWAAAFAPVIAVVAVVTALVLLFQELLKLFLDGKGIFATTGRAIADAFRSVVNSIKSAYEAVKEFFVRIGSAIKGAFESVINWISDKIDWAWEQVKKIAHYVTHPWQLPGAIADYFTDDGTGVPATANGTPVVQRNPKGDVAVVKVDSGDNNITINAASANAQDVANLVDEKIKQHDEQQRRQTHADTGGDDEDQ